MIDREHDLSITKQAEILQISRGSVYYLPRPVPDADRLPDQAPDAPWAYGTDVDYMRDLVPWWRDQFDWRARAFS